MKAVGLGIDRGEQFGALVGGERDILLAQARDRGLDAGDRGVQVVAHGAQDRGAQGIALGEQDGLGRLGMQRLMIARRRELGGEPAQQPELAPIERTSRADQHQPPRADIGRRRGIVQRHRNTHRVLHHRALRTGGDDGDAGEPERVAGLVEQRAHRVAIGDERAGAGGERVGIGLGAPGDLAGLAGYQQRTDRRAGRDDE